MFPWYQENLSKKQKKVAKRYPGKLSYLSRSKWRRIKCFIRRRSQVSKMKHWSLVFGFTLSQRSPSSNNIIIIIKLLSWLKVDEDKSLKIRHKMEQNVTLIFLRILGRFEYNYDIYFIWVLLFKAKNIAKTLKKYFFV